MSATKAPTYTMICSAAMALVLAACATPQENPNYKYSSKYKGETGATTSLASYPTATTTYASTETLAGGSTTNHACLNKETNRELLGGAIGGTVGAIAGKKLIGGTKGTIIGAGLGGAAGYGIGDKSIDCDPLAPAAPSYPQTTTSVPYTAAPSQSVAYEAEGYAGGTPPTDDYYGGQQTVGTPGYDIIQGGVPYEAPQAIAEAPAPNAGLSGQEVLTISGPVHPASAGGAQVVDYDYSDNIIDADTPVQGGLAAETRQLQGYGQTSIAGQSSGLNSGYIVRQGDTVYSLARTLCVGVNEIQSANGLSASFGIQIGQTLSLPSSRC